MDLNQKLSLLKKRLEWHTNKGFFQTKFNPIPLYDSPLINDTQYIEFIRVLGPIELSVKDYLVLAVSEPYSYKSHYHWWRDTNDAIGEHGFDSLNPTGVKIKDVQLIACDSSLYFWGYDTTTNPSTLVGENFLEVFKMSEFFYLIEAILSAHENYLKIKIPDEFKLSL